MGSYGKATSIGLTDDGAKRTGLFKTEYSMILVHKKNIGGRRRSWAVMQKY